MCADMCICDAISSGRFSEAQQLVYHLLPNVTTIGPNGTGTLVLLSLEV